MNQYKNYHECFLQAGSTSCLAKLPPNSSFLKIQWRRFRKNLLVSESHEATKFHYRSTAAIQTERKRQIFSYPSFIIHPFSNFSYYREVVMFFVFCITFILSPITNTFLFHESKMTLVKTINICTDLIIVFNIGMCFISGYHELQTKEIILEPKKIAANYIKSYFWTDLIGSLPVAYFLPSSIRASQVMKLFLLSKHLFMYPRVLTMLQYFRHITIVLRIGDAQHEIIRMVIFSFFLLHWSSCILYVLQYIYYIFHKDDNSWMIAAKIHPMQADVYKTSVTTKYLSCLHMGMSHFYRIGRGLYRTYCIGDYILLSGILIAGGIYYAYIIVIVLQAIGTANAAESKYEELMRQLYDYLRSKKMPFHINLRLRMYYEYRFQKRYFREQSILSTLSEHLRYEIKLYTCRHLIGKVDIFKGLSKSIIGSIIGGLTLDIYLTNDVIIQSGTPIEFWYIISYGTVSVIHKSGAEIEHLEDGECFGENCLLKDEFDINYVATEISEVFRMPKVDFMRYMANETIASRIHAMINMRRNKKNVCVERFEYQNKEKQQILYKVRSGKILEKGHERRI